MRWLIPTSVILLVMIAVYSVSYPAKKVSAFQIFSPFGGKVKSWLPDSPGCAPITKAISVATLGTVNITVEELDVSKPKDSKLGILRVDGFNIPGLTNIYKNYAYQTPGTWVLGNSINVCDACDKVKNVPGLGAICDLKPVKEILDVACSTVASDCPITNLVHYMGVSLPPFVGR